MNKLLLNKENISHDVNPENQKGFYITKIIAKNKNFK